MNKQEAIDVIEAYRRNMEHILGAEHETVKAIQTCEMLVGELEEPTAQWDGGEWGCCTNCGHQGCASDIWDRCEPYQFCPNCGIRMEGV